LRKFQEFISGIFFKFRINRSFYEFSGASQIFKEFLGISVVFRNFCDFPGVSSFRTFSGILKKVFEARKF
jgi:hypothetical protein